MDIKIFLMIFGGIGTLVILFRIIFGFIPKGNEFGKPTKWTLPGPDCNSQSEWLAQGGLSAPFWDSRSTYYTDE